MSRARRFMDRLGRQLVGLVLFAIPSVTLSAQELLPELDLPPQEPMPMIIPPDGNEMGEALLRGPVHEAFAELHQADPTPGMIIAQRPPVLIEEAPPEMAPQGRNIEWIPGYWAFDDEASDFIWISGIWREIPPGLRWLPGYWLELENQAGYQWISGSWVPAETEELRYLPEIPPVTLERGPVGVAPSAEHIWVPGCWMWQEQNYAWRAGYWSVGHENWVWIPARYHWTPRGYVFCRGYWDYPLVRRGWLFSPYRFHRPFFDRPAVLFTPQVVVSIDLLPRHLWVRPTHCHYYFGDYYDDFAGHGFVPWHHWAISGRSGVTVNVNFNNPRSFYCGYDPLFNHFSRTTVIQHGHVTHFQQQIQYFNDCDRNFQRLQVQRDHRPSRNWREFQTVAQGRDLPNHDVLHAGLGRTLEQHREIVGRERIHDVTAERSANLAQSQIARHRAIARQEQERRGGPQLDTTGLTAPERSTNRRVADQAPAADQRGDEALQRRSAVQEALRRGTRNNGRDGRLPDDNAGVPPEQGLRIRPGTTEAELRSWVENHQRRNGTDPNTARGMAERLVPQGSIPRSDTGLNDPPMADQFRGRGLEPAQRLPNPRGTERSNIVPQREVAPGRGLDQSSNNTGIRETGRRREITRPDVLLRQDLPAQRDVAPGRDVVPQREVAPRRETMAPRAATPPREVRPSDTAPREFVPRQAMPQREVVPRRETLPERAVQPTRATLPERAVQPTREVMPQREAAPRREVPQRELPARTDSAPQQKSGGERSGPSRGEGSPRRGQGGRGEGSPR